MRWQGTNGANGLLRRAAPTVTEHRAAVCGRRTKTHLNEESLDQGRHKYPAHDQYNTTFFHRWSHFVSRDLSDRNFSNKVIYRPLMLGDRLQKGISMNRLPYKANMYTFPVSVWKAFRAASCAGYAISPWPLLVTHDVIFRIFNRVHFAKSTASRSEATTGLMGPLPLDLSRRVFEDFALEKRYKEACKVRVGGIGEIVARYRDVVWRPLFIGKRVGSSGVVESERSFKPSETAVIIGLHGWPLHVRTWRN